MNKKPLLLPWVFAVCLGAALPTHATALRIGAVGDSLTDEYLKANDMAATDIAAWNWVQILANTRNTYLDFGQYKPSPSDNWGGSRDTGYEYNWAKSGGAAANQTRLNVTGFGVMPITVFGSDYLSTQVTGLTGQISAGQIDTVFIGAGSNDFYYRTNWLDASNNATPIDLASVDIPAMVTEVSAGVINAMDAVLAAGNVQVLVAAIHIREEGQTDARSLTLINAANQVNANLATAITARQAQGKPIAIVDQWAWGADQNNPHHQNPDRSFSLGDIAVSYTAASQNPTDGDVATQGTPGSSSTLCTSTGLCATSQHPTHFTADDGLHPNTLVQALLANEVLEALNTHFNMNIPLLSDPEIQAIVPPVDTDVDGQPNATDTDDDNDGLPDVSDNCPISVGAGTDQTDTDADGAGNLCDKDDDNDGIPDTQDAFPLQAGESLDSDGDGTGNNADTDDDNDGVVDGSDNCPVSTGSSADQTDTDADGAGNVCDDDDDNDGVADAQDAFPLNASETQDVDGDSIGNNADTDDDNDGVADGSDNCPLSMGAGADQTDTDADGDGNVCDNDDDNDGVVDAGDSFPLNTAVYLDFDDDGAPDNWNTNCDATCQANAGIALDNCVDLTNIGQLNTDGDAQGDACDIDDDNDTVSDDDETALGTDPLSVTSGPGLLTTVSFENGVPAGWSKPAGAALAWITTNSTSSHLANSLRSGAISHNQQAQIQVTLPVYGNSVSVDVKASTEAGKDIFRAYVDGLGKYVFAGVQDWKTVHLPTTSGTHTFRFEYWKNASISSGNDSVWIDKFTYIDGTDTDNDGQINVVDPDDDNDGLPDAMDPLPLSVKFNLQGQYKGSVIRDTQEQ